MHTNHQIEKKCRPYLDQLIEQLKKRNPNDLLYEACEQHDKALYDLAIQLGLPIERRTLGCLDRRTS